MAAFCCTADAFLLTWWLLHSCFHSHEQAYSPACVGMCSSFLLMRYLVLFFFFFSILLMFCRTPAVAVELEFLGGSSPHSLLSVHCCASPRGHSQAQRWGESWGAAPAERDVSSSMQGAAPGGIAVLGEAVARQVGWSLPS